MFYVDLVGPNTTRFGFMSLGSLSVLRFFVHILDLFVDVSIVLYYICMHVVLL